MTQWIVRIALAALILPLAGTGIAQSPPMAPPPSPYAASPTGGSGMGGSMTLAQFQARQEQRIMAADTDGDGRISLAEYSAAMSGRRGGGGGSGEGRDPSRMFARMDTNHDGFLSKAEIDAAATERFRRMDTNGDGVVKPDERMAARGGGHRGMGHGAPAADGGQYAPPMAPPPGSPQP